ncbi:MAG: hypothetical protein J5749_00210 [Lachnospiraceae bacterium]|nr:hypothetical protein [Lachnospiraceae bacterium]
MGELKRISRRVQALVLIMSLILMNFMLPAEAKATSIFPTEYDLRDVNGDCYVTSVKDQGNHNMGWAFAACAAMESNALTQDLGELDFSEYHLGYMATHVPTELPDCFEQSLVGEGTSITGDWYDASLTSCYKAELLLESVGSVGMKGYSPTLESEYPYSSLTQSLVKADYGKARYRVKSFMEVGVYHNLDAIKEMIYEYGAVVLTTLTANYDNTHFNDGTNASYVPYDSSPYASAQTHTVTLVGWDDGYDAFNFNADPGENGAFIVKNSFGTDWGDEGYFYLSYKDHSLSTDNYVFAFEMEPVSTNDYIYQYDSGEFVTGNGVYAVALEFTATDNQKLNGIKLCFKSSWNESATIYVDKMAVSGNTIEQTLATFSVSLDKRVNYTPAENQFDYRDIPFQNPVEIAKDDRIRVRVEFDYDVAVAYGITAVDAYASRTENNTPGHTYFVRNYGGEYEDTAAGFNKTVCMKVVAEKYTPLAVTSVAPVTITINNGTSLADFTATLNAARTTQVTLNNGNKVTATVQPGFKSTNPTEQYASLYEQFSANNTYDPTNKQAQEYVLVGNVDVSSSGVAGKNPVNITIRVTAGQTPPPTPPTPPAPEPPIPDIPDPIVDDVTTLYMLNNEEACITLFWHENSRADGYRIYRKPEGGEYSLVAEVGKDVLKYKDEGLRIGSVYTYKVAAFVGKYESDSMEKTLRATIKASWIKALDNSIRGQVRVTVSYVSGATRYGLYRQEGGTYKWIAGSNTTTLIDRRAKKGVTYFYKTRAYRENLMSALSLAKSIKVTK